MFSILAKRESFVKPKLSIIARDEAYDFRNHASMKVAWVRPYLKAAKIKQVKVARAIGLSEGTFSKALSGERRFTPEELLKLAPEIGLPLVEMYARMGLSLDEVLPRVALEGRVGAGQEIVDMGDGPVGQYVPCPLHLDPKEVRAVEVDGDSMWPLRKGWLLFYSRKHNGITENEIGHLCVVQTTEGVRLVKEVRRGKKKGTFDLLAWSAEPREGVRLAWASRVLAMLPPE